MSIDFSSVTVRDIAAVNIVRRVDKSVNHRVDRERFAFAYKAVGKTIYVHNGKEYISDKNHLLLIPMGATYTTQMKEAGECFMIEFDADGMDFSEIHSFDIANASEILTFLKKCEHIWSSRSCGYRNRTMASIYDLFAKLEKQAIYVDASKRDKIYPSVRFIEENYCSELPSLDKISEMSGISEIYFRKLFLSIYGMPPKKYILLLRISKAKELLISDFSGIGEVAEAVGFGNVYNFCKVFKKITGFTPTEYSKLNKA